MGIRLSFEVISPLGPDDKDLLTGISIMTLAIANHELAKEHFPGVFPDDEDLAPVPEDDEHEAPTTPPSSPPQARDAQDRDEAIARLLGKRSAGAGKRREPPRCWSPRRGSARTSRRRSPMPRRPWRSSPAPPGTLPTRVASASARSLTRVATRTARWWGPPA